MTNSDQIDLILSILKFGGILVGWISGVLGTLTKTHDEKTIESPVIGGGSHTERNLTGWGKVSLLITSLSFLIAGGAQLAEDSRARLQDVNSNEKTTKILNDLGEQKEINARMEREFREKIQIVLVQLSVAKQEDSKKITEEKIRVIQKDFSEWATNFTKNLQKKRGEFDNTKRDIAEKQTQAGIEEIKKEIRCSQQCYPAISFALRYVQESVRAYAAQTGKQIKVDLLELPENFFENGTNQEIQFSKNAVWKIYAGANRPLGAGELCYPYLQIVFTDTHGKESGTLRLITNPPQKAFAIKYSALVPTPDPKAIDGSRNLTDYESSIREVFQAIVEAQLLQTIE